VVEKGSKFHIENIYSQFGEETKLQLMIEGL